MIFNFLEFPYKRYSENIILFGYITGFPLYIVSQNDSRVLFQTPFFFLECIFHGALQSHSTWTVKISLSWDFLPSHSQNSCAFLLSWNVYWSNSFFAPILVCSRFCKTHTTVLPVLSANVFKCNFKNIFPQKQKEI